MGKLNIKRLAKVLRDMQGNISATGRAFGVTRQAIHNFIKRHPQLQQVLIDARETMIDNAESVLQKKVLEGEAWAVCFTLKTQGKNRGYVERQEYSGPDGGPIAVTSVQFGTTTVSGNSPEAIEQRVPDQLPLSPGTEESDR